MVHQRRLQLLLCSFVIYVSTLEWDTVAVPQAAVREYTFSLSNTNAMPIWIALFENEDLAVPVTKVEPVAYDVRSKVTAKPDIRKSILLAVWFADPGRIQPQRNGKEVAPAPDQLYTFTPGKTLYVTWRPLGQLAPQAGMLWGLMPESKEGFNLDLNVDPSDVIYIEE